MRSFDLTPLYRTSVGFDRLASILDQVTAADVSQQTYPPYNIEKTGDDSYVLTMAVAGFSEADIEITAQDNTLTVSGKPQAQPEDGRKFLHRGIAGRAFERRFVLADHIQVQGADMENGLLHVSLKREVPEALKPRRIEIGSGKALIEGKKTKAA